jgi:thioredoxin-related protein
VVQASAVMNSSQKLLSFLGAYSIGISAIYSADESWMTDFEAAKAKAEKENKTLLIDFTGSDWCGWCVKLDKEVFKHDAFKNGVKDKFVLVEVDFPQDKEGMSEATIAQNDKLQEEYGVDGFPTILLTDAKGRPFAKTGYEAGGPEKYVESLDELLKLKTERDDGFKKAAGLEGVAKADSLIGTLKALELSEVALMSFYGAELDAIKKADPADKSGFVKDIEAAIKFAKFESELGKLGEAADHKGALALVEKTLEGGEFEGERKQQLIFIKGIVHAEMGEFDKSMALMEEAKAVAPESEMAGQIDSIKGRLKQMKEEAAAEPEEDGEEEEDDEEEPADEEEEDDVEEPADEEE